MKKFIPLIALLLPLFIANAAKCQDKKATDTKPRMENQIRKYWFVMLLKGPKRDQDSATAAKIQTAHLNNINRLYNEGKLKVAGPFGDNGNWLGIFIFDCETKEEVEKLLQSDMAVSSGRLTYDIRPWYTAPTGSFKPGKPNPLTP
jgi:uncharacterized protein